MSHVVSGLHEKDNAAELDFDQENIKLCENVIKEGDLVILYHSHGDMDYVNVQAEENKIFNSRAGSFPHKNFIGKPFGTKLYSTGKNNVGRKGHIYLLKPSPFLWTQALNHRTQILYSGDISLILFKLNIKPGSVVIESGTGSGSLSTWIANSIKPHGHLHTFEYNLDRVNKAKEDFERLKLTPFITVRQRDVTANGFPRIGSGVDAVFLDLPSPHQVIESAVKTLRHGGRLANFSPCIEQSQRCALALAENGATEIMTFEILLREWDFKNTNNHSFKPLNMDSLKQETYTNILNEFNSSRSNNKNPNNNNNNNNDTLDISSNKTFDESIDNNDDDDNVIKDKDMDNNENSGNNDNNDKPDDKSNKGSKRDLESNEAENPGVDEADGADNNSSGPLSKKLKVNSSNLDNKKLSNSNSNTSTFLCRPFTSMRGHTGFLTFATINHDSLKSKSN